MATDVLFTNGVIAVKEKYLLKDKLLRMCEMSAEEAFRALVESGFGGAETASSVYEYDRLVAADERDIDRFIREYARGKAELVYLLAPRDYHNAKAMVKAESTGAEIEKLLAPDGLVSTAELQSCFKSGDFSPIEERCGEELGAAVIKAREYLAGGGGSGAEVGAIFDRALYACLARTCRHSSVLCKLVRRRADMTNILTALRAEDGEHARKFYVPGGRLTAEELEPLLGDTEGAESAFAGGDYSAFAGLCLAARKKNMPMTEAERLRDSADTDYLAANRFELKANQPFLYYVFRRRAENANVRIVFACLLSGMGERAIKSRLRAV